jgi:Flp pilus assembly protein TadG
MRRFWSDQRGNIAVLFAFAIVPVVGAVGAAVDYSLAVAYRTDMQKALDSTALALSKILPASQETLDTVGMQYFQASMGNHTLTNLNLVITPTVGQITLDVKGNYAPKIATLFGATSFEIGAKAVAKWGIGKVEVALALDNSLSMQTPNPQRIIQLKAATHNLLTILESSAQQPGDAKVAIIPFDGNTKVVATPVDNTWITNNSSWLRWDLWDKVNGTCNKSGSYNSEDACESQKVCTKPQYTSKTNCQNNGGSWINATWTPKAHTTWTGCVQDRDKDPSVNYDVNDTAPSSTETKYPAWQCYNSALSPIFPLSTNWGTPNSNDATTLHGKVNALTPTGYTNITIGLAWALHALSPTNVLTEAAAFNTPNLTKIIVLLTDGENTCNRWEPTPCQVSGSHPDIDARTTAVCQTIRDLNIRLYTIRLIDGTGALLQACATNPSMYYDVQDAGQLAGVFSAIGAEISNLHLAK